MIQAFGLTSDSRKDLPPSVDDVSFEAHAGRVTALLGTAGSGKTTTLRLMLELQQGCGVTYFRGRPLHRVAHPSREVGVLLGGVPGHPARTVRGHLRMLCAVVGLPARRADQVLETVGLVSFREERLGTLSRGVDRRLGLACVLLADPHALVLDAPADGLPARECRWLHGVLRAHANQGGTVLFTTADPKEAARAADRVVTLERGRLVADQEAADFARHRLRPRVTVRSPHASRLGALLAKEARTARRSVEVVGESGNRLYVYGSTCADVGEAAFRHGILIHQLADEVGDMGAGAGSPASAAAPVEESGAEDTVTAPDGRQPSAVVPAAGKRQPAAAAAALAASAAGVPCSEGARLAGGEQGTYAASAGGDGSVSSVLEEPSVSTYPEEPSVATRETPSVSPRPDNASGAAQGVGAPPEPRAKVVSPAAHTGSRVPAAGADEGAAGPGEEAPATRSDGPDLTIGSDGPDITTHPDDSVALTGAGADAGSGASWPATHPGGAAHTNDSQPPGPTHGPEARTPATASLPLDSAADFETRDSTSGSEALGPTTTPEPRDPTADSEARAATATGAACVSAPSREPSASAEAPDGAAAATTRPDQPPAEQRAAAHPATGHLAAAHPMSGQPAAGHLAAGHSAAGHSATGQPMPAHSTTVHPAPAPPAPAHATPSHPALAHPALAHPATDHPAPPQPSIPQPSIPTPRPAEAVALAASSVLPPPISVRRGPSPLRPLRYELRRAAGVRTGFLVSASVLVCSAVTALVMGRMGHAPQPRLLAAWPRQLPLPPAALGAGLLGALAFGDEFRHPALAADRGTVPRRLGLLAAKLTVATATALLLAFLTVGCNAEVLYAVYGQELTTVPGDWLSLSVSWIGLAVGCAWAGVLAGGVFRSTTGGLAAVLSVPVLVAPLVRWAMGGKAWNATGLPARLRHVFLLQWSFGGDRYLAAAARMIAQPVGGALALTLVALLCAYLLTALRSRTR
ncbi:ATP-binding cassette domain-containing protein [Streptomyces sp. CoT10]|uniref:ATP-binding cassette domain-containing protein n=1 Tax=Streptomyces sp. CoT10 TaxID=2875762 RepID=UPI001CD411FF|nr:ATP-binding cassette domain-containing protein [Streptomyces sp. CoT10]